MSIKQTKEMKKEMKAKAKALSDAHKSNKKMPTKPVKCSCSDKITNMIASIVQELEGNMHRHVGNMSVSDALDTIERLQELRDTENFHTLKWGK